MVNLYWLGTAGIIVSECILIVAGMLTLPFGIIMWLAASLLVGWWGEVLKRWVENERQEQGQRATAVLKEARRSNPVDYAANAQNAPWN